MARRRSLTIAVLIAAWSAAQDLAGATRSSGGLKGVVFRRDAPHNLRHADV
jgi:hypothetical protein